MVLLKKYNTSLDQEQMTSIALSPAPRPPPPEKMGKKRDE